MPGCSTYSQALSVCLSVTKREKITRVQRFPRIRNENTVDKELPIHLWLLSLINRFMVSPVIEMLRCVFKKRERGLRPILLLVFLSYGVYLFILPERHILYLYMLRSFEGFTGEDFAYFNVVIKLAGATA